MVVMLAVNAIANLTPSALSANRIVKTEIILGIAVTLRFNLLFP